MFVNHRYPNFFVWFSDNLGVSPERWFSLALMNFSVAPCWPWAWACQSCQDSAYRYWTKCWIFVTMFEICGCVYVLPLIDYICEPCSDISEFRSVYLYSAHPIRKTSHHMWHIWSYFFSRRLYGRLFELRNIFWFHLYPCPRMGFHSTLAFPTFCEVCSFPENKWMVTCSFLF